MNIKRIQHTFLTILVATLLSCSGNNSSQKTDIANTSSIETKKGEQLYNSNCATCHQTNGMGIPGAFPPLAGNKNLNMGNLALINLMLEGKSGELVVNEVKYNGIMPPFTSLTDEEIATVLTYTKVKFSSDKSAVTTEEVKKIRVSRQ